MNSQKQTDSHQSSRDKKVSSKKLAKIRLHVKTEKDTNPSIKLKHRNSVNREPSSNQDSLPSRVDCSLKSIREESASKVWRKGNELRWKLSKTNDTLLRKGALPQIDEYRGGGSEWASRNSIKKSMPSKSIKIPFQELIPIKQISKQERVQNLRRIRDEFRELVNTSNNILVKNNQSVFRAYVEKGNNSVLVKELLKKRWWWHIQEKQPSRANFFWSQWFNRSYINDMPQIGICQPCDRDYNHKVLGEQPKVQSIRMILDESTFSKIKPRISLRDQHYLKGHKSIPFQKNVNEDGEIREITEPNGTIHNHIDGCLQLHSKKLLFKNLYNFLKKKNWDPFEYIPITYYIDSKDSSTLAEIMQHYDQIQSNKFETKCHNLWIVKPGQNSNRGFGITVHSNRAQLKQQLERRLSDGKRSVIVQKYLQKCFLVYSRKFDIRCYILITTVNGYLKGYWYNDGYIRTSSEEYDLSDVSNRMIHLTNDAVQKHNSSYGKYEDFNKMSFANFKKYISKMGFGSQQFDKSYDKMKLIAFYLISSVSQKIKRKQYTFELFGLDFMLDDQLKPLLIEANSNPCLQTSGVILGKLIPQLVDNVLMTAVDPLFPAPNKGRTKQFISKDYFRSNKFQLIFTDGGQISSGSKSVDQTQINFNK